MKRTEIHPGMTVYDCHDQPLMVTHVNGDGRLAADG